MNTPAQRNHQGVIISAPSSRAGKTTVALGLMRALKRSGHAVQAFKSGPDYIDTAFHAAATGRDSINIDTWAMHERTLSALISNAASTADISIVEGAMGLFDGAPAPGQNAHGTTADIAALTGWPVILVVDVARQAATAAAIVKGCATYRDDISVSAVILNNVASIRHEDLIKPAIEALGIPVVASLKRCTGLSLPERHLGLVQASESSDLEKSLNAFADILEACGAIDTIKKLARPAVLRPPDPASPNPLNPTGQRPPGQTIALAHDPAFSFVYRHLLASWRSHGARIVPFSPLADEPPATDADAVWLPGGYPELHTSRLARANRFKDGVRALAANGVPVHGECGGYMVLGDGLIDKDGVRHEMLGLLRLETSFKHRKLHLGYRQAQLNCECSLGPAGQTIFGHEFHYATILKNDDPPLVELKDAHGTPIEGGGSIRANVSGTFFHVIDSKWRQQ